ALELADEAKAFSKWAFDSVKDVNQKVDPDDLFDLLEAIAKTASEDEEIVGAGFDLMSKYPNWHKFLTEPGRRTAVTIADMLTDMPGLAKNLSRDLVKGENLKNLGKLVSVADSAIERATTKMFPTILEQTGEVGFGLKAAAKVHKYVQKKFFGPANKFFSDVYLAKSPGYAVRNGVVDFFTTIIDEGVAGVFGARYIDETFDWAGIERGLEKGWLGPGSLFRGGPVEDYIPGVSKEIGALTALDKARGAEVAKKWYQKDFKFWANKLEGHTSRSIAGKVYPREMRRALKGNVSKMLVKEVGIEPKLAKQIDDAVIENRGVAGAFAQIRENTSNGFRRLLNSNSLTARTQKYLDDWHLRGKFDDIIRTSGSAAEAEKRWISEFEAFERKAKEVSKQTVLPSIGSIGSDEDALKMGQMADSVMDGSVSKGVSDAYYSFHNANKAVNRSVSNAISNGLRNVNIALDRVLGQAGKSDIVVKEILDAKMLKVADGLGGGTMKATDFISDAGPLGERYGVLDRAINDKWTPALQNIDAAEDAKALEKIWKDMGLEKINGSMGGLTKAEVHHKGIEALFTERQRLGELWRDENYKMAQEVIEHLSTGAVSAGAKGLADTEVLMSRATKQLERAREFDKHLPYEYVRSAVARAKRKIAKGGANIASGNKDLAVAYAKEFGLQMYDKEGRFIDKWLTNVLNKQLNRSFVDINDITGVTDVDLRSALKAQSIGESMQILKAPEGARELLGKFITDPATLSVAEDAKLKRLLEMLEESNPELYKKFGQSQAISQMGKAEAGDIGADVLNLSEDATKAAAKAEASAAKAAKVAEDAADEVIEFLQTQGDDLAEMVVEKGAKHVTPLPEWGGMEAPTVG
ncbi:hypothetical protein LCGC14_1836380, partial [marine sediment metagenome]